MEIYEVDYKTYFEAVNAKYFFDSSEFNKLNSYKVDEVKYLIFKDTKKRFGVILGVKDGKVKFPFSAPFACIEYFKDNWEIYQLEEAMSKLDEYFMEHKWTKIQITLPPLFYDETFLTCLYNILFRLGYKTKYVDLNFQINLKKTFTNLYKDLLPRNGKKNLRISLEKGLKLIYCDSLELKRKAYQIIEQNREEKGYPLRMTFKQVEDTIQIVNHDFFIVEYGGVGIAAAQIFYITEKIVQVIYWGDIQGYSEYKPINFLAYSLIQFYGKKGIDYIDIGPSSEFGIPNHGLCSFKNSIGCDTSAKMTFEK